MIQLDDHRVIPFLRDQEIAAVGARGRAAQRALINGTGAGSEWLGWRDMLAEPNDALLEKIEQVASHLRASADVIVVVGIGGSYLGAKALLNASGPYFRSDKHEPDDLFSSTGNASGPEILFAGHHMSGRYLTELLAHLEGKSVYLIVISKSGTTLEPAIAFRVLRKWLSEQYENYSDRVVAITDAEKGALYSFAVAAGYERFVIPDNVGGRFSVLTPVGLLPAACGGIDIRALFYGAVAQMKEIEANEDNDSLKYAVLRHALLNAGYETEVMAFFEPSLNYFAAWFQQLFGESEGKNHSGIFPTVAAYSTDLHSIGQYVQDGRRTLFETFLMLDPGKNGVIPTDSDNLDGLNYIAGMYLDDVNEKAYQGTAIAHESGGVPNMTIRIDSISEENMGRSIYFFEHAVSIGGYLLGVNPFDQPGVEAYKKEMFSALGKPIGPA